jgi:hypothetical protein
VNAGQGTGDPSSWVDLKELAVRENADGGADQKAKDRPEGEERVVPPPGTEHQGQQRLPGQHRDEEGRDGDEEGDEVVQDLAPVAPALRRLRLTKDKSDDLPSWSRASAAFSCE